MSRITATQRKVLLPRDSNFENEEKNNGDFRNFVIKTKALTGSSGSVQIKLGNTNVVCSINGPKEQNNDSSEGSLNISIVGADTNIRFAIESALKSIICLKKLARTEIDIEFSVLADDGGVLAAALIAASFALIGAKIECFDILVPANILIFRSGEDIILDPSLSQINAAGADASIGTIAIMPTKKQIVCVDIGTNLINRDVLKKSLRFGYEKCIELFPTLVNILRGEMDENVLFLN